MSGSRHRFGGVSAGLLGPLLLAGAAVGEPGAGAAGPATRTLDIVWVDVAGCDPAALLQAGEHLAELFAPLGFRVTSRVGRPAVAFLPGNATVVVKATSQNPRHAKQPVAGETSAERGAPPVVQVFSEPLARALGLAPGLPSRWTPAERRLFAHAVALVVAHELGHRLAGLGHTSDGFMAPTLDLRELRCRSLRADEGVATRLRSALALAADLGR